MSSRKRGQFSAEIGKWAIRLVRAQTPHHSSQWAAIGAMAQKLRCSAGEPLAAGAKGQGGAPDACGARSLQGAGRLNLGLLRANDIIRKASAVFAVVELDSHIR
jgi:transposase